MRRCGTRRFLLLLSYLAVILISSCVYTEAAVKDNGPSDEDVVNTKAEEKAGLSDELPDLPSGWVDPTDMLNYDLSSGAVVKPVPEPEETPQFLADDKKEGLETEKDFYCSVAGKYTMEQKLEGCQEKREEYKKANERCQKNMDERPVGDEPFFQQYVRQFLSRVHKDTDDTVEYNMAFKLSPGGVIVLEKFASSQLGNLQDAHHVLSDMVVGVEVVGTYKPPTWSNAIRAFLDDNIQIILQVTSVISMAILSGFILMHFHWNPYYMATRILFMLFVISIGWNWWHLYKLEVAKQYAAMTKDVPAECKPDHKLSVWEAVTQSFSLRMNACTKYHQEVMVDPLTAVPPTKALAVTITTFLTEPLEHIARAFGRSLQAALEELPVKLWPFVLTVVLVIILLAVFRGLGLRLRVLPFLTLEPAHQPQIQAAAQPQALQPAAGQPAVDAGQPGVAAGQPIAAAAQQPVIQPAVMDVIQQPTAEQLPQAPQGPRHNVLPPVNDERDGLQRAAVGGAGDNSRSHGGARPKQPQRSTNPAAYGDNSGSKEGSHHSVLPRVEDLRPGEIHDVGDGLQTAEAVGGGGGGDGQQPHGGARPKQPRQPKKPDNSGEAPPQPPLKTPISDTQPAGKGELYDPGTHQRESAKFKVKPAHEDRTSEEPQQGLTRLDSEDGEGHAPDNLVNNDDEGNARSSDQGDRDNSRSPQKKDSGIGITPVTLGGTSTTQDSSEPEAAGEGGAAASGGFDDNNGTANNDNGEYVMVNKSGSSSSDGSTNSDRMPSQTSNSMEEVETLSTSI